MSSTTISLQATSNILEDQKSLSYLIARINEQKGSFRNVTEESLQVEVEQGPEDEAIEIDDDDEEEVEVEEVEDEKSKRERLAKARAEMLKHVSLVLHL